MSQLQVYARQLETLNKEVQTKRSELKVLLERRARVQSEIVKRVEHMPNGFKYNGHEFKAGQKVVRKSRKDKDKVEAVSSVLKQYGVTPTRDMIEKITESMRGVPVTRQVLQQHEQKW